MLGLEELAIEDVLKFISSYRTAHPVIQHPEYMTSTCILVILLDNERSTGNKYTIMQVW